MSSNTTWSPRFRYLILIGVVFSVVVLLWYYRELIGPLVIAALLAYLLNGLVDLLARRTRLSHKASVVIIYIIFLFVLFAIPVILAPMLVRQIQKLEIDISGFFADYQQFLITPFRILDWTFYPRQFMPDISGLSTDVLPQIAENVFVVIEAATKNFVWVLVILVTIYYLLKDWSKLRELLFRLAPPDYEADVQRLYKDINIVWSDYLRSQLSFMLVVGIVDALVWLAIGLPGAVILGMLTGVFSIVPELGAIVAGVLSILVALVEGSSYLPLSNFWFAVLVLVVYFILTNIKNIWIRPIIIGRGVHIHEGVVFVVVIAALIFQGVLEAFIVVPILGTMLVLGRYLRRRIIGLPPFPELEVVEKDVPLEKEEGLAE